MREYTSTPGHLPDKLLPFVDEARLDANAAAYEEMQRDLGERERAEVAAIAAHLLLVPLVHTFRKPSNGQLMLEQGLYPNDANIAGAGGNTFQLDKSLGLDTATFQYWGELGDIYYGESHLLIDAEPILKRAIVTPHDISDLMPEDEYRHMPYAELPRELRELIDRQYFSTMVRGSDWLEINARRIQLDIQDFPGRPIRMQDYQMLGEVKYKGVVPPEAMQGVIYSNNPPATRVNRNDAFDDRMIGLGFIPRHMLADLQPGALESWEAEQAIIERVAPAGRRWEEILAQVQPAA